MNMITCPYKWFSVLFLLFLNASAFGQDNTIKIINADTITQYDHLPGHTIIKGHVVFEHKGAKLYCDSAYLEEKKSILKAYSRVQINQGDTINLFGDSLHFNGKTRYAKVRGNVRFRDREYKLTTDSLDFDMKKSYAFYRNGGTITHVKENQTITSRVGYYYGDSRSLYFRDSVKIKAPKYTMTSDTLQYSIREGKTYFYGPSTIKTDSMTIYCEDGFYDTENERGTFKKNAYWQSKSQTVRGDSLFIDQKTEVGIGQGNVSVIDTTEKIIFTGQYMEQYQKKGTAMVCDDAVVMQYDNKDTLYIRADTLWRKVDTLTKFESLRAYHDVRILSKDMKGLCDSASYNDIDSLLHLYHDPILWSDDAQITGDSMKIKQNKKEIDKIWVYQNAMTIRPADSLTQTYFSQVSGKFITAYLDSNKLKKIKVVQNAETVYFSVDDSLKYSGMNVAKSSEIYMYMLNNKIERVTMILEPVGTYYPFDQAPKSKMRLENFEWRIDEQPKTLSDLYQNPENMFWEVVLPIELEENIDIELLPEEEEEEAEIENIEIKKDQN